jgi:putative copper export protein
MTSSYGVALLTKLAVVAVVVVLGAKNRAILQQQAANFAARIQRSGTVELLLAAPVLVLTTVLVASA